ncbi:unnamed protein product [Porites lobata]|uniref:Mab-21-like HhH/H2TH-like domain-containing protein n=1 Tax=Porites lobata TaxID=104759 RepID=A0ABN8R8X0_9CNID|nr:unnamed protein product [Porites lobata]
MASSEDSENEYLSDLYECLAATVNGFCTWRSFLLKEIFEMINEFHFLRCRPQQVRYQLYGSSAEDLHVGVSPDIDAMFFPTADELKIDDELIEYCFPSNPLYVRIRGTGHPVLQSCLAENTEYVATSTLKNFHPAIFGPVGITNNADDVIASVLSSIAGTSVSVKNSMTSPAVKCTFAFELTSALRKLVNKHIKGGAEESVPDSTFLPNEDETEYESTDSALFEIIPAFLCLTWPMVAQEWSKRHRKWPSPDVVDKVIREGFHLVVKAPKNGGNPECDFRISFSHSEFLLSQEMNEIQRECYRCLKTYHRVYLSTEAKGLISFHLKNIFLRTIEETGGEMWIGSRRAECMWKLFANLLKALRERHLPHYFVQSYNLFGIDYIEDPAILESLTERVEQIMENPVKFAKELILITQGKHSSPVQEQEQMDGPFNKLQSVELMLFPGLKKEKTERVKQETRRKVYQDTIKDLIQAANNADGILENLDPMERTVVEDLREIQKEHSSIANLSLLLPLLARLFSLFEDIWNLNDINLRHHVLAFVKQVTELFKHLMPLYEAAKGPEDILRHMLNLASENPFEWNLFHLPGLGLEEDKKEIILTLLKHFVEAFLGDANSNGDDIPLD